MRGGSNSVWRCSSEWPEWSPHRLFHSHNATCIFPQFELQLILAAVAPPPPALPLQTQASVSSRCAECDERNGTASANPQSLACPGDVEGAQLVFCLFFHEQFVMRGRHLQMECTHNKLLMKEQTKYQLCTFDVARAGKALRICIRGSIAFVALGAPAADSRLSL